MNPIKVVIHGASGRVGQVLISTLQNSSDIKLAGAVDIKAPAAHITLADGSQIPFSADLGQLLTEVKPDVMVDFTIAKASMPAVRTASAHKVSLVIGTTGFSDADMAEMNKLANDHHTGIFIAPNFALGAVLMMHFAKIAARYMDYAEIIELHHDKKLDAPSGTSINTARMMAAARGQPFSQAVDDGQNFSSRGQKHSGVIIHSVRLPGLMAHQEVLLGGLGQTLSIRHDTIGRDCYTPGVLMAIKAVVKQKGLVMGLDKIMDL